MKVIFSNRAYTALLSEVYEKIETETGGVFLGYYENGTWYIVEAIDPGPHSVFEVAYFEYDQPYVNHLINKIARIYKKNLSLIGLWHRHPGSFDVFSGTDDGTNTKYAKMFPQGAISALVNIDPKFRLTVYHVSYPLKYERIKYEVGDHLFPNGVLALTGIEEYTRYINTYAEGRANGGRVSMIASFTEIVNETTEIIGKFDGLQYRQEIYDATKDETYVDTIADVLAEDLDFLSERLNLRLTVKVYKGYVCVTDDQNPNTALYFSLIKSIDKYVFIYDNFCYLYQSGLIKNTITDGNIVEKSALFARIKRQLGR